MSIDRDEIIAAYREAIAQDIPLDWVIEQHSVSYKKAQVQAQKKRRWADLPFAISMVFGVGLILVALTPTFSMFWHEWGIFSSSDLIAPIPSDQVLGLNTVVNAAQATGDPNNLTIATNLDGTQILTPQEGPLVIEKQLDYRNLAAWFDSTDSLFNSHGLIGGGGGAVQSTYTLDIPKLNVKNALIRIGGVNLNNSLIQYETTAAPGDYGAPVIFGHSTLRQWYNPDESNPERYMSIFSTIMTLEKGDLIYINRDGKMYTYRVTGKQNVKPTEKERIIGQDTSGKFLKLITCTPEGTTVMRGIVTAVLVEDELLI